MAEVYANQVSQLQAQVVRLTLSGSRAIELLACSMGFDETEEWANLGRGGHKKIATEAIDEWNKAKGTKP